MNFAATVSVVIPAFNAEAYLGQTLDSVFAQSCLPLEVIVVDDGSTDGTAEIARHYPVQLIQQENRGICTARNVGIRASKGTWIALLDNDDIWLPHKLEEQLRFIQRYPEVGLVVSDLSMFGTCTLESIFKVEPDARKYVREAQSSTDSILRTVSGEALAWVFIFMPSMWIIRREVLEQVGMFWDGLEGGEDWHLFFRILARHPIGVIELPLIRYRVRRNSQSRQAVPMSAGRVRVLTDMMEHPDRFPKGMAEVAYRLLPDAIAGRAYAEYHAGLRRESRASFALSLQHSYRPHVLWRWWLSWLPLGVYRRLSYVYHAVRKRGPQTPSR